MKEMPIYQVTFEAEIVVTVEVKPGTSQADVVQEARIRHTQRDVHIQDVLDVELICGDDED
jgi:hypothetical protein